jgi:hypothetical protein
MTVVTSAHRGSLNSLDQLGVFVVAGIQAQFVGCRELLGFFPRYKTTLGHSKELKQPTGYELILRAVAEVCK